MPFQITPLRFPQYAESAHTTQGGAVYKTSIYFSRDLYFFFLKEANDNGWWRLGAVHGLSIDHPNVYEDFCDAGLQDSLLPRRIDCINAVEIFLEVYQ